MAIVFRHDPNAALLGEYASLAGSRPAERENAIRSIEQAVEAQKFNAQIGQQTAARRQQAFENAMDREGKLRQDALRYNLEQQQNQLDAAKLNEQGRQHDNDTQYKWEALDQKDRQAADALKFRQQQGLDRESSLWNMQAVKTADTQLNGALDAIAKLSLNPEGQALYKGWLSKYRAVQDHRKKVGMRDNQFASMTAQLMEDLNDLGLHRHVVTPPPPQEVIDSKTIFDERTQSLIGVDDKGKPFKVADKPKNPMFSVETELNTNFDKHIGSAEKRLREKKVREYMKAHPNSELSPTAVDAMIGELDENEVSAEMMRYLASQEKMVNEFKKKSGNEKPAPEAAPDPDAQAAQQPGLVDMLNGIPGAIAQFGQMMPQIDPDAKAAQQPQQHPDWRPNIGGDPSVPPVQVFGDGVLIPQGHPLHQRGSPMSGGAAAGMSWLPSKDWHANGGNAAGGWSKPNATQSQQPTQPQGTPESPISVESEADAAKLNPKPGTVFLINGRRAVWE